MNTPVSAEVLECTGGASSAGISKLMQILSTVIATFLRNLEAMS